MPRLTLAYTSERKHTLCIFTYITLTPLCEHVGVPPLVCLQLLHLKLSDYLADFHLWMSVYSRPSFSSFTHTQRLSVCLLLLLGYACVNTLLISQMDDQVSYQNITTGMLQPQVSVQL